MFLPDGSIVPLPFPLPKCHWVVVVFLTFVVLRSQVLVTHRWVVPIVHHVEALVVHHSHVLVLPQSAGQMHLVLDDSCDSQLS